MNIVPFEYLCTNGDSSLSLLAALKNAPQMTAIAGKASSGNISFIIIGLVVIVIILVVVTFMANRK